MARPTVCMFPYLHVRNIRPDALVGRLGNFNRYVRCTTITIRHVLPPYRLPYLIGRRLPVKHNGVPHVWSRVNTLVSTKGQNHLICQYGDPRGEKNVHTFRSHLSRSWRNSREWRFRLNWNHCQLLCWTWCHLLMAYCWIRLFLLLHHICRAVMQITYRRLFIPICLRRTWRITSMYIGEYLTIITWNKLFQIDIFETPIDSLLSWNSTCMLLS